MEFFDEECFPDPVIRSKLDSALNYLIDNGLVEMTWSEEEEDFLFSITEKGREYPPSWS